MATWLDRQIEQLESIVDNQLNSYDTMCTANRCVLPGSHGNADQHMSLGEFLEMQVRHGARIFANPKRQTPREFAIR